MEPWLLSQKVVLETKIWILLLTLPQTSSDLSEVPEPYGQERVFLWKALPSG